MDPRGQDLGGVLDNEQHGQRYCCGVALFTQARNAMPSRKLRAKTTADRAEPHVRALVHAHTHAHPPTCTRSVVMQHARTHTTKQPQAVLGSQTHLLFNIYICEAHLASI